MAPIENIKKLFDNYMLQAVAGMFEYPEDFNFNSFSSSVMRTKNIGADIVIYDIEDDSKTHYGSITLEIDYEIGTKNVTNVVYWAQVYGIPAALEFEDLEACLRDMIERRKKFNCITHF